MSELLLLFNALLLTRMVHLKSDAPLGIAAASFLALVQLAVPLLLFTNAPPTFAIAALVITTALLALVLERLAATGKFQLAQGWRALTLLLLLLGSGAIVQRMGPLEPSWLLTALQTAAASALPLLPDSEALPMLNLALFGLLLLANEANIAIRAFFHHLELEPRLAPAPVADSRLVRIDEEEYQAGRAIGILERWLMFLVVFSGNDLTAIGFIIAVKGLVRFKRIENDSKDRFAEYLLVGTLLSTLFAILVAQWMRALLQTLTGG